MPSKRTNDSVDRILQDLNRRQAEEGVRDAVTDHQVDEILRSVGIMPMPLRGTEAQDNQIAFSDDLLSTEMPELDDWSRSLASAAPRTEAVPPHAETVPPHAEAVQPIQPTVPDIIEEPPVTGTDTLGDTTRTGIIKNFLLKMAPEGSDADADALNQGKNQFKKFFEDSVAVVPGEKSRKHNAGKKRRGLFGLKSAEDTDEFVPINVSLGASPADEGSEVPDDTADVPQPSIAPAPEPEEYDPNAEPEETFKPAPKKHGFLSGLFGGGHAPATEEIYIPEARQSEVPAAPAAAPSEPNDKDVTLSQELWHSKYTHRPEAISIRESMERDTTETVHRPEAISLQESMEGDTTELVRRVVDFARRENAGSSTTFRKKRNTVEFIPGQTIKPLVPEAEADAQPVSEPVGEPIDLPKTRTRAPVKPAAESGFTMQLGSLDPVPSDSTQEFMSAYNAVRRVPKSAPVVQEQASAEPTPKAEPVQEETPAEPTQTKASEPEQAPVRTPPYPGGDPYADTAVVCLPSDANTREVLGSMPFTHRQRDEVDELVDTLTGHAPAPAENDGASAHTGFTQDLAPVPASALAYTVNSPADTGEPTAASGFTQHLGETPAEPGTASFVRGIADSINTEDTLGASQSDDGELRTAPQRHTRRGEGTAPTTAGVRLTGAAEDEDPDTAESPFDTAQLPPASGREYERIEDAPAVRLALEKELLSLTTDCLITGAITAVLLILGFMAAASVLPEVLSGTQVYPAVALVLLLAACGVCRHTVLAGLRGLVAKPSSDAVTILPAAAAAVQCLVLLATGTYTEDLTLLAGPAVLVLCLNTVGKRLYAAAAQENFSLVSANVDHAVAYRLRDTSTMRNVTQGLAEPHPNVLVSRPTSILRSFLARSATRDTCTKTGQQLSWLVGGCSLAAMLFTLIRTKDAGSAVTVLAAVCCLAAPLASTLYAALPMRLMQRNAAQVGAVVPGWHDIRQLGRINVIQVTARDLFPAGSVSLAGIKPVKPEHIDLAIVYAASILADAGPTLREVFLGMLGDNRSLLAEVTDRETVSGKGYIGWIHKRRVLVGNRALMQDYGVKIPGLEYERHHTVNQRRVIYLAVSGKLFAMFQVAYQRDADTAAVLEGLRQEGLSLIVDCDDFNCDEKLLETAYNLPIGTVKVLDAAERRMLEPSVQWLPESDGNMLHLGSFASFVGGLEAAAGASEGEKRSSAVVSVSILFGCVMGILFTLTGGLLTLPLPALVLYQAAWCVLALFFPLTQRY